MRNKATTTDRTIPPAPLHCPDCGEGPIRTRLEARPFMYGEGVNAVQLSADVPVHECQGCGFQFLAAEAEDIQHAEVCRHLAVLTPGQIRQLRASLGMSRAEFARVTRLGEATIARWERGALIQNAAYDSLLYLLTFPDNLDRLTARDTAELVAERRSAHFRLLKPTTTHAAEAAAFSLRGAMH